MLAKKDWIVPIFYACYIWFECDCGSFYTSKCTFVDFWTYKYVNKNYLQLNAYPVVLSSAMEKDKKNCEKWLWRTKLARRQKAAFIDN